MDILLVILTESKLIKQLVWPDYELQDWSDQYVDFPFFFSFVFFSFRSACDTSTGVGVCEDRAHPRVRKSRGVKVELLCTRTYQLLLYIIVSYVFPSPVEKLQASRSWVETLLPTLVHTVTYVAASGAVEHSSCLRRVSSEPVGL